MKDAMTVMADKGMERLRFWRLKGQQKMYFFFQLKNFSPCINWLIIGSPKQMVLFKKKKKCFFEHMSIEHMAFLYINPLATHKLA